MSAQLDAIDEFVVVGAGPAGVAAALALSEAGRQVRVLDAGRDTPTFPPAGNYLDLRRRDKAQWRWQLGSNYPPGDHGIGSSPKMRVPGLRSVFDGYADANRIVGENGFQVVGALAAGGLSNAWGCGVAAFTDQDLASLTPAARRAMRESYARTAQRMGISGANDDALTNYLGVDDWADPGVELDGLHARLWRSRHRLDYGPVRLGRARVAVLTRARAGRAACDLRGMCLWGCESRATWSAALDLPELRARPRVHFDAAHVVKKMQAEAGAWRLDCMTRDGPRQIRARNVLLGAGTIASTRLALHALGHELPVRMLSNPMAAFLLVLPRALGSVRTRAFGLAQLSFAVDAPHAPEAFGNLFSTAGLPLGEFLEHLPLGRSAGLPLLRSLLPATIVANAFLSGGYSAHHVRMRGDTLVVEAGFDPDIHAAFSATRAHLAEAFRRVGAWMLPGSFIPGLPGADIHYAATMPMRARPARHECRENGAIDGLPGVYAIDGASLPSLPAKAHTLTIMANADRIARELARRHT